MKENESILALSEGRVGSLVGMKLKEDPFPGEMLGL